MRQTIRFGRGFGIEVGANWSLLVVVLLVAGGLATVGLPGRASGHSATAYWVTGAVCGVLVAGSLFLHELAHCRVALRVGVPVERITLWMLGGARVLSSEPVSVRTAFRIAIAGPLAGAGLGVLAGGGSAVLSVAGGPPLIVGALWWLGAINVFIAVVNLLPGDPLDGGQLLRAALRSRHGDPLRAALEVARAGIALGVLVAALGAGLCVNGRFAGLWLILTGVAIGTAARRDARTARMRIALGDRHVDDVMCPPQVLAFDTTTVDDFLAGILPGTPEVAYPVLDIDGRAAGTVLLHDLVRLPRSWWPSTRVRDVRRPLTGVPVGRPNDLLADLAVRMGASELALVVQPDHQLLGVVRRHDLNRLVRPGPGGR